MKKPVPISDEEAYDGSRWTYKHDDLIKHIIDQIGHPDQHLDEIARELATQIGPDAQLRASLLERYSQEYLDDCTKRCTETARQMVQSKRLMVIEPELAGALSAMERHGNTLSPVIRNAWDGQKLQTLTRASPLKATGAHISTIGHITEAGTRARLSRTEMANGLANRFLFGCVKRSKLLPHGGNPPESVLSALFTAL